MNVILLVSVLTTTVIYSAFSTQLQIQGDAMLRVKKDIRITNIEAKKYNGDAIEIANPKYSVDSTSMYVKLPKKGDYVTYEVTVTNKSDIDYWISKMTELSHNPEVSYIYSLKLNEDVIEYPDTISNPTEFKFTITITNEKDAELEENLNLQYTFVEVTYKARQLSYSNAATTCKTVQCALDELAMLMKGKEN